MPFLWAALAAGCALPFSSRRYREPPPPPPTRGRRARQQQQQHQLKRRRRLLRALWAATSRGLALFLLGLFLNNGRDVACWRVTGPLQALGFALWAVQVTGALLQYFCPPLASPSPSSSGMHVTTDGWVLSLGVAGVGLLGLVFTSHGRLFASSHLMSHRRAPILSLAGAHNRNNHHHDPQSCQAPTAAAPASAAAAAGYRRRHLQGYHGYGYGCCCF